MGASLHPHHVSVVWIIDVAMPIVVFFANTHIVEPLLQMVHVEAWSNKSVDSLHLLKHEEVVSYTHHLGHLVLHLGLDNELLLVTNFLWVWSDVSRLEIIYQLLWNFFKNSFCQKEWVIFNLTEWNELHNVSWNILIQFVAVQRIDITIKLLHLLKFSVSNTNYNDWQWQHRSSDNLFNGFFHVINNSVCNDQANWILLFELSVLHRDRFRIPIDVVQDARKVCSSIEFHFLQWLIIGCKNSLYTIQ